MQNKWKIFFKTMAVSLSCCAVFISLGYFYLKSQNKAPVENKAEKVPYSYTPESVGILFNISGDKAQLYLDFANKTLNVIIDNDIDEESEEHYGYPIDYTVNSDYSLISGIVDAVGGIELEYGEEELFFTGVQVENILTTTVISNDIRTEIIRKIVSKIASNGFSRDDFLYIIENSETDLTVPDCYYWQDYISEVCKTVRILDLGS